MSYLTSGPISPAIHGATDYVFGLLLVIAPFLLDFSDTATTTSIVIGAAVLSTALVTRWSTGVVKMVEPPTHGVIDHIVAVALIASPFLLGFADEAVARNAFLAVGVIGAIITMATRFVSDQYVRTRA